MTHEPLLQAILWLLLGATALSLLVGLALILFPGGCRRLAAVTDRWVSVRRAMRPLEVAHYEEPLIYRHHRGIGFFIVLAAAVNLYQFMLGLERPPLFAAASRGMSPTMAELLVEGALQLLVAGNILALLVGLTMYFRPSLLRGIEGWANRWISVSAR